MENSNEKTTCLYAVCSNWRDQPLGYNWLNYDYPFLHDHDHWEIYLVTKGAMTQTLNGKTYEMNEGDGYLLRPQDAHATFKKGETCQNVSILMKKEFVENVFSNYGFQGLDELLFTSVPLHFKIDNAELTRVLSRLFTLRSENIPSETKYFYLKVLANTLLTELLNQHFTPLSRFPDWFSEFLMKLNDPHNHLTVDELAFTTPYSYSQLSRIFKDMIGTTLVEYVTQVKMKYASDLLVFSNKSVIEITNELGYDSPSYFNRIFKKYYSIAPTEYRKKNV